MCIRDRLYAGQSKKTFMACLIMRENNYKPQIPDVMEAIFDAAYLTVSYTHLDVYKRQVLSLS